MVAFCKVWQILERLLIGGASCFERLNNSRTRHAGLRHWTEVCTSRRRRFATENGALYRDLHPLSYGSHWKTSVRRLCLWHLHYLQGLLQNSFFSLLFFSLGTLRKDYLVVEASNPPVHTGTAFSLPSRLTSFELLHLYLMRTKNVQLYIGIYISFRSYILFCKDIFLIQAQFWGSVGFLCNCALRLTLRQSSLIDVLRVFLRSTLPQ